MFVEWAIVMVWWASVPSITHQKHSSLINILMVFLFQFSILAISANKSLWNSFIHSKCLWRNGAKWFGKGAIEKEKSKIAMRHHRKISFFVNCLIAAEENYVCLNTQWSSPFHPGTKSNSFFFQPKVDRWLEIFWI